MNVRERRIRRRLNEVFRSIEIEDRLLFQPKILEIRRLMEELVIISVVYLKNDNEKKLMKRTEKTMRKHDELALFVGTRKN